MFIVLGGTTFIIDIMVASLTNEDISKTLQVYIVTRPCSSAKTISKEQVGHYTHLKNVSDKLHLSGGAIDLPYRYRLCKRLRLHPHSVLRTRRAHRKKKTVSDGIFWDSSSQKALSHLKFRNYLSRRENTSKDALERRRTSQAK